MRILNEVISLTKSSFLTIDYQNSVIGYVIDSISKGRVTVSQFDFKDIKSIKVVSGKSNWGLFFIISLFLQENGGFETNGFPKLIIKAKKQREEILISDLSENDFNELKSSIKKIVNTLNIWHKNKHVNK